MDGITQLLKELNGGKVYGPAGFPNMLLKKAAEDIAPFLKIIFDQSIQMGH